MVKNGRNLKTTTFVKMPPFNFFVLKFNALHSKKRTTCSGLMETALNNVVLPTVFNVVNNIVQHCCAWISPQSGVTILNNIVDNIEQCGQHNIVQGCFHQPWTGCAFLFNYACRMLKVLNTLSHNGYAYACGYDSESNISSPVISFLNHSIFNFSRIILVYYCKCCNLIGYSTHYLFIIR